MTAESNNAGPSSGTRVGILLSGLSCIRLAFGASMAATERCSSIRGESPSSATQIMTLRTYGDFGDQCSFIVFQCSVEGFDAIPRL